MGIFRSRVCCVLATATLCMVFGARAEPVLPPTTVDSAVDRVMTDYSVPGLAIGRIENGDIAWLGAYGKADENRPVNRGTLFNVASLTKPLFGTLMMQLVEDDRFSLDEPLANYWIDPDVADDPRHRLLTARLALSHQSGLPNWRGNNPLFFMFEPGSRHEYSGEGFEYVRRAVEQKTGQSMPELMDEFILAPLKLNHTYFGWHRSLEGRIATGYDEAARPMDMGYLQHRSANAAANTFTTIGDYSRFAAWVSTGAGLTDDLFSEMVSLQSQHSDPWEFFGISWRLLQFEDKTILEHDGRENGVRTQLFVDPSDHEGLVIFTNSSNGELVVRPLVLAAMPNGEALLYKRDADTWHYLQSLPGSMHWGMMNFISQSPSFTQKLLHAAYVGLVESSGLDESDLTRIQAAIDPVVLKMHQGALGGSDIMALLMLLGEGEGESFRLAGSFEPGDAKVLGNRLLELAAQ